MSNREIIRIEKLVKTYHMGDVDVHALDGVNLTIEEGSYVAIKGASGSGKSTLLNMLGCLDRASSGRYYLGGRDVSTMDDDELSAYRGQKLGFVFQSYNLIQQLTVIENIFVPLFYQGLDLVDRYDHCRELADLVGLGDRLDHRPKQLSGGQQQRVAIARSLVNDPLLILADEPTGNLDSKTGVEILDLFSRLHEQGKTLIVVTHGDEVADRAQREIVMKDGVIHREKTKRPPVKVERTLELG